MMLDRLRVLHAAFSALVLCGFVSACGEEDEPVEDPACYSPDQNAERAYEDGAVGCVCAAGDAATCVRTENAAGDTLNVALICDAGQWQAVVDGPCAPSPGGG